ncbi:restriction endonuclease subunit S [Brachybacterium alimentarium]|uniref:restriction endonuclease subunit S n=1 Tax=Brachybacterium alimentarium TaxID=47845 RepID=UPI003FD4F5A5
MSRIDELIQELCPDGVAGRPLGSLGTRNKGTAMTASKMKTIGGGGPIRVFAGGQTVADVAEDAIPAKDIVRVPSIIVKSRGHIGFSYYERPFTHKTELWSYTIDAPGVDQKFVYYYLLTQVEKLQVLARATSVKLPQLSVRDTDTLNVPVPPFEVQREIVRVLDKFTQLEAELEAELEARRSQYEHYRTEFLTFGDDIPWRPLGEIATVGTGRHDTKDATPDGEFIFYARGREPLRLDSYDFDERAIITAGDGVGVGKVFHFADGKYALHQRAYRVVPGEQLDSRFIYHYLVSDFSRYLERTSVHASVTSLRRPMFLKYPVPVPSRAEQERIVATLDKFEALVSDISIGLPAELAARRKQYEHYRDRLLTFKELAS